MSLGAGWVWGLHGGRGVCEGTQKEGAQAKAEGAPQGQSLQAAGVCRRAQGTLSPLTCPVVPQPHGISTASPHLRKQAAPGLLLVVPENQSLIILCSSPPPLRLSKPRNRNTGPGR